MSKQQHKGKARTFCLEWILEFGLEISTHNSSASEVSSPLCLFCCQFGWEDEDSATRNKTGQGMSNNLCTHGVLTISAPT
jgi:hypothetical protein